MDGETGLSRTAAAVAVTETSPTPRILSGLTAEEHDGVNEVKQDKEEEEKKKKSLISVKIRFVTSFQLSKRYIKNKQQKY